MASAKPKISQDDVQLFLLGELQGEKARHIAEIDATDDKNLRLKADKEVKKTLLKIRRVDDLLKASVASCPPIPTALEKQIDQILAASAKSQKKNTTTILDKIKTYFTGSNIWSLAGGGAAASFAMLAVIQIQPALLVSSDRLMQTQGSVFRSVGSADPFCGIKKDGSWIVTDEFLIQIPVCSVSGEKSVLVNGGTVNVGDKFSVFVLPTRDVKLTVRYLEESGTSVTLLENPILVQALAPKRVFETPLEFSEPKGKDSLKFETVHGSEYSINFVVE